MIHKTEQVRAEQKNTIISKLQQTFLGMLICEAANDLINNSLFYQTDDNLEKWSNLSNRHELSRTIFDKKLADDKYPLSLADDTSDLSKELAKKLPEAKKHIEIAKASDLMIEVQEERDLKLTERITDLFDTFINIYTNMQFSDKKYAVAEAINKYKPNSSNIISLLDEDNELTRALKKVSSFNFFTPSRTWKLIEKQLNPSVSKYYESKKNNVKDPELKKAFEKMEGLFKTFNDLDDPIANLICEKISAFTFSDDYYTKSKREALINAVKDFMDRNKSLINKDTNPSIYRSLIKENLIKEVLNPNSKLSLAIDQRRNYLVSSTKTRNDINQEIMKSASKILVSVSASYHQDFSDFKAYYNGLRNTSGEKLALAKEIIERFNADKNIIDYFKAPGANKKGYFY